MVHVEYLNYFGSMITNDARCAYIQDCHGKVVFNEKKTLCTSKMDLIVRKKLAACYT